MLVKKLFKTDNSIISSYLKNYKYPYEILPNIEKIILELGENLGNHYIKYGDNIWIHRTAKVSKTAEIHGPCIIDEKAEIRHNAYIRGNAIIGKKVVFGNSCEIKNSILFDECQVPHFSYVGDSIIGYKSHFGAGVITSNLKLSRSDIIIKENDIIYNTGLKKIGAIIGDNVEVGCNCVLNPGTVIYPNTIIYPLLNIRGVINENKIVKSIDNIIDKK